MNLLDLIVCLALVAAVWNGLRRGLVVQLCSLAGLLAALWIAARWGAGAGRLLGLDERTAAAGGFLAVMVAALVAVGVAARLLRGAVRFAGLGLLDRVLGVAVAAVKWLVVVAALFAALDRLDGAYGLVEPRTRDESKTFRPLCDLAERLYPRVGAWGGALAEPDQKPSDV